MKNLIVCCDGTWNDEQNKDDGLPAPTNIKKIFDAALANDPAVQQTRYQTGVGTEGLLDKAIGGILGAGIGEDIRDCYQWLSDKYQPGDEIYLFGFSRGAFTARSLAGMIGRLGLIDFSKHKGDSRAKLVEKAYIEGYRNQQDLSGEITFYANSTGIHFLGVFDTVGALGVPDDKQVLDLFDSPRKYRFHDTALGDNIGIARHAVAADEIRGSFSPTLWTNTAAHANAKQLWFPGVHSDVGGGYKETGLSDCALKWMTNEAKEAGLAFNQAHLDRITPDHNGELHDSYKGVMKVLRSAPRSMPNLDDGNSELSEALKHRHQSPSVMQGPYLPTRSFSGNPITLDIYAKHKWYWTGIYLEAGKQYKATAEGEWRDSSIACPPSGTNDGNFQLGELVHLAGNVFGFAESIWKKWTDNEKADFFCTKRVEHANWFELIGAIANAANPEKDGTHAALEIKVLGSEKTFTVSKSGYLYCFANDAWGFYHNNKGYVTLTIEEVSS